MTTMELTSSFQAATAAATTGTAASASTQQHVAVDASFLLDDLSNDNDNDNDDDRDQDPSCDPDNDTAARFFLNNDEEDEQLQEAPDDAPPPPPPPPRIIQALIPSWIRFGEGDHVPEATGLSIDMYARGHVIMSSLFLGPALLELAREAANCDNQYDNTNDHQHEDEDADDDTSCKIYGFRPSSLLSNIAICAGLLGSVSMPVIGAIVDHTPYRKQVALWSAVLLSVVKGSEVMVGPSTWFYVAILQVVSSLLYSTHATAAYAYTSELTTTMLLTTTTTTTATTHYSLHEQQQQQQARYNAFYNAVLFGSCLFFLLFMLFLIAVVGLVLGQPPNDVITARISQVVTCTVSLTCFSIAWKYYFRSRNAQPYHNNNKPSLWTVGFTKVWHTSQLIVRRHRSLSWAILAIMFAEAAVSALITIATTYAKEVLHMTASEIGIVFFLVLSAGIPGSHWASHVSSSNGFLKSPIISAMVCHVAFILVTTAASCILTGPAHKNYVYGFAMAWGMLMGWLTPTDITIFMNLMPQQQHTSSGGSSSSSSNKSELMGIMMLATSVLSWLPPLIFSTLNEIGLKMAWGLASLNIFFLLAFFALSQIVLVVGSGGADGGGAGGDSYSTLAQLEVTSPPSSSSPMTRSDSMTTSVTMTIPSNNSQDENVLFQQQQQQHVHHRSRHHHPSPPPPPVV